MLLCPPRHTLTVITLTVTNLKGIRCSQGGIKVCLGVQEVTLLGLLGYLSYLCGDVLGLSGIVSLFCCAVAISHYALHNVNSLSRVTTVSAFQTLSYVSEGAIFIYVGMDALDPIKWTVRPG